MPNPLQHRMEDMSIAYLQAICAKNGYDIWNARHDNDCVDCQISCNGFPINDGECVMYSPLVAVQLKASFAGYIYWKMVMYSMIFLPEITII